MAGRPRTGQTFTCPACGEDFYRQPSHIKRGITKSCGKRECMSVTMSGPNNPFWEKTHTEETRAKLVEARAKNPPKKTGPEKGVFKQTLEARAAMSAAVKERWKNNRDKMLANIRRGEDHPYHQIDREPYHRVKFTDVQKELWIDDHCAYCDSKEDLVLDHVIPAMAGGKNVKHNSQTLCQPCNRWKMRYVDLAYYNAILGDQGGQT